MAVKNEIQSLITQLACCSVSNHSR